MSNKAEYDEKPFPSEQKDINRARFRRRVLGSLRAFLRKAKDQHGINQRKIAYLLRCEESQLSKQLNGEANLTLNTIADLTLAMRAKPQLIVIPEDDLRAPQTATNWHSSLEALEIISESAPSVHKVKATPNSWIYEVLDTAQPRLGKFGIFAGTADLQWSRHQDGLMKNLRDLTSPQHGLVANDLNDEKANLRVAAV
jgi:transcriptional regulator with XRE-family HTH domain